MQLHPVAMMMMTLVLLLVLLNVLVGYKGGGGSNMGGPSRITDMSTVSAATHLIHIVHPATIGSSLDGTCCGGGDRGGGVISFTCAIVTIQKE
jgi:hypothetical protein